MTWTSFPAGTSISMVTCAECGLVRCEWLTARQAELLPVPYFHVVFTVPAPVAEIAFQNKETVYAILFHAAAETLRTIAADPKHLGAEIGLVAMLHTWARPFSIIRMSTASCRAAARPWTACDGSPAARASSCQCGCSPASSAGSSWSSSA